MSLGFSGRTKSTTYVGFFFSGQDNILAISPSNKNFITNLTNVHVALFNEQDPKKPFSFSLGLKKIPSNDSNEIDGDIYVTTPFQPPRQPFKIYVRIFF